MKEVLNHIYDFLATHDFPTILAAMRKLEWSQVARNPYIWLILLPLLTYLLWTKKFKAITAITSFILFLVLIQTTLSPDSEAISVHDLLIFVSGAAALIGLNIYMLFVRQ